MGCGVDGLGVDGPGVVGLGVVGSGGDGVVGVAKIKQEKKSIDWCFTPLLLWDNCLKMTLLTQFATYLYKW